MKVLLLQFDGKLPNLALMRIAAHHWEDEVELRHPRRADDLQPELFGEPDVVYGSLIFRESRPLAERARAVYPDMKIGGTGWDLQTTLEGCGIPDGWLDYSIYPECDYSIGYTQRGCRFSCPFCVVSEKEGVNRSVATISDIWRGGPRPRDIVLLDNDFFGQPAWVKRIAEMVDGEFRVCFTQGINCRTITEETAKAVASVKYYDRRFKTRRIYTAWDNPKDEKRLMAGLEALVRYGVKPDHIMVYMLIGYWPGETVEDWEYRRRQLRAFGARPYPMPYIGNAEARGFQRWIVGAYDKRVPWTDWVRACYQPRNLGC
jgi:hypothetical protein